MSVTCIKKYIVISALLGGMMTGCTRPEAPEQISGDRENAAAFISDGGNESLEEESLLDYGTFLSTDSGENSLDATNQTLEEAADEWEMEEIDDLMEAALSLPTEDDEVNGTLSTETGNTYGSYLGLDKTIEMLRKSDAERGNVTDFSGNHTDTHELTYRNEPDADSKTLSVKEAYKEEMDEIDALWKGVLTGEDEVKDASGNEADSAPTLTYGRHDGEETALKGEEEYESQVSKIDAIWKDMLVRIHENEGENATEEDVSETGGTFLFVENPYIIVDGKGQGIRRTRGEKRRIIDTFWKDGKIAWQKGYFNTGEVWYEQTYLNDKIHGMRKEYGMDGNLVAETSYVDGKRYGSEKKYDKNGNMTETVWENDRIVTQKEYYPSGAIRSETPYLNDKKNGVHKVYSENGEIVQEIPYWNDKGHGTEIKYYREGKYEGRITKKQLKEGVILSYEGYYASGEVWFDRPYKDGDPHGTEIKYYRGGKNDGYVSKRQWEKGVLLSYKGYYPSGEVWFDRPYKDGDPHGTEIKYYRGGKDDGCVSKVEWKDGIVLSHKGYYSSGEVWFDKPYKNGEAHGGYKEYDDKGRLLSETSYVKGKVQGARREYGTGGQFTETYYIDGLKVSNEVYSDSAGVGAEDTKVQDIEKVTEAEKREKPDRRIIFLMIGAVIVAVGGFAYAFKAFTSSGEIDTLAKIKAMINKIGSKEYRDGSSIVQGKTYHPIPFEEFNPPIHKKSTVDEYEWIKSDYGSFANKKVLDVGCANGYFTFNIAKDGAKEVVGYEGDSFVYDVDEEIRKYKNIDNVKFVNKYFNIDDVRSFEDNEFDVVILLNVHMWIRKQIGKEGTEQLMKELCKKCKLLYFQTAHKGGSGRFVVPELASAEDIEGYLREAGFLWIKLINQNMQQNKRFMFRCSRFKFKGKRSRITVDVGKNTVTKKILKYEDDVFLREVNWLKTFGESNRFPSLISYDEDTFTIVMSYCGEALSENNCPVNWEDQMGEIMDDLKKYNCCHNDIKPKDLLIKNGKIMLVDFGRATKFGEKIPVDWPKGLGGAFRLGNHQFDDEYSFRKSIEFIKSIL